MQPPTASPGVYGNYELIDLLGRGGMGEVWRARHTMLGREAAVKLVRPDALGVSSAMHAQTLLRRFEREATSTSRLQSPHTIQLYDFGVTDDGTFYYAMELLHGLNFKHLVDQHGPVEANRTIYLLRQVCESLEEAHHHGLIHRDVKPANAYLCKLGLRHDFVKVLDFGLVKTVSGPSDASQLTTDDAVPGSPAFLAPETVSGQVDERTDIYALGCVAYWLLTGQVVFEGATAMEMVVGHLDKAPEPPSHRTELPIPAALEQLVLDCLRKDPGARPQSMRQVAQRLGACPVDSQWSEDRARTWWERYHPSPPPEHPPAPRIERPARPEPAVDTWPPERRPVSPGELSTARAEAVHALKAHFVSSHIDVAELERRTKLATRAEHPDELEQLLLDLPEQRAEVVVAPGRQPVGPSPRVLAVLGGTTRKGAWRVPRSLEAIAVLGGATLDLRDAQLEPGCTEIQCRCVMAGVMIVVPPDLYVEVDGVGIMGGFASYEGSADLPTGDASWVRITGWAFWGGVGLEINEPD